MITPEECAEFAALETSELFTGAVLSTRHRSLLASYLLNLWRGSVAVRKMIVADIRAAIDLGASKYAADLFLVLRLYLSKHPDARMSQRTGRKCTRAYKTCGIDPRYRMTVRFFPGAECRNMSRAGGDYGRCSHENGRPPVR
ncbi:hypothetical protein [Methylocystis echinoides]|uniref:Uncharacterized protein n=1 Tax=Methylocystis echinoides TaxID=29468 RepID=A0A9W6LUG6_9HYPH|nr:hypothetical protein [Methylocystis echinoides]GLI95439.1 hypothetical protein LMG27198_44310 [Methylocystis echinoides]